VSAAEDDRRDSIRRSDGCACHINPPCSFCEQLNEAEFEAYCEGRMPAVEALWNRIDAASEGGAS